MSILEKSDAIGEDKNELSQLLHNNMPKKRFFRSRAHCNPLSHNNSFAYPLKPSEDFWSPLFAFDPSLHESPLIRHLDVGCGFGGLTVALARIYPTKLSCGMEIRAKVCEYVRLRIEGLRKECPGQYGNATCLRTNCMRYLPNFFLKGQLEKIFFCFPDPHFKQKNHRRRIISFSILSEYAYFLAPGGRLYTITDVEDLHRWHEEKIASHSLFRRLDDEDVLANDPAVRAMHDETEEGIKVARMNGRKFFAVFERLDDRSQNSLSPLLQLFP